MADDFPLTVKYGKETLELRLPADATVAQLQVRAERVGSLGVTAACSCRRTRGGNCPPSTQALARLQLHPTQAALEERTGLFARKQKLMAAGKVVSGRPGSLTAAGLRPGAKLMLLAGAGGPTAGQAALEASRQSRQEALERGRQQLAERAAQKGIAAGAAGAAGAACAALTPASMRQRAEAWQKTGIAALRDLQLSQLPAELFAPAVASGVRVLDAGGNALAALPPTLSQLTGLQRLRLSINRLSDEGAAWPARAQLTSLIVLAADDNRLTALPPCVAALARLQKLSLNGNQIGAGVCVDRVWCGVCCVQPAVEMQRPAVEDAAACRARAPPRGHYCAALPHLLPSPCPHPAAASLPDSIGALQQLRALALRGNRLAALPASLGSCSSLVEVDLRDNQLAALPEPLGQLTNLKLLLLDNNR